MNRHLSSSNFTILVMRGWYFGAFLCDAWLTLDYVASNTSVMNLLIICIDRYLSVSYPVKYRNKRKGILQNFSRSQYLTDSKGGLFVPTVIFSQSPIVYVQMGVIDWLKMSLGQIVFPCSQRDIHSHSFWK